MKLIIDADVQVVAAFMQGRIQASRLVAVAGGIAALAPVLWGHYGTEGVQVLRLESEPIIESRVEP